MVWLKRNAFWLIPALLILTLLLFLLLNIYGCQEDPRFEKHRFLCYMARGLQPVSDTFLRPEEKYGPDLRYTVSNEDGRIFAVTFHILPLGDRFLLLGMEVTKNVTRHRDPKPSDNRIFLG